ncbi:MAG: sulfatase [Verrucomicrobiales bacterium]|nr:sulfatase [Verrucomicrobiales bacterium]
MKPILYFFTTLLLYSSAALASPNFLIIVADDCTYNDLPIYGGANAKTPNIDQLASEGLIFNQAYLASAMCQPCRAELYTGLYPMSNGCAWNHSASRPETKSLPHFLQPAGYRVGLSGKTHVKPKTSFPFDKVAGFDPGCVRNPTRPHDLSGIRDYMSADDPFCLVVCLVEPHIPWVMGDASQYPPAKIKLPPNLADTPETRNHFADYLAEVTYMDGQVGEIVKTLDETGKRDETIVLFTSEQGSQFPGCKWTNWNTGLHTALIASWPGRIPESARTDALVQYADVVPTLLELAGVDSETAFDGTSFAKVLTDNEAIHREFAYGIHNNLPEGPAYPIRSITDGKFRYIRNLSHGELYIEKHLMGGGKLNNPYWATWVGDDPMANPESYDKIKRYMLRPEEQLYHTLEDGYEIENIAGDAGYDEIKARLSTALDAWLKAEGDPGAPVDTKESLEASRAGKHLYGKQE